VSVTAVGRTAVKDEWWMSCSIGGYNHVVVVVVIIDTPIGG
jgi:hypothetical protein